MEPGDLILSPRDVPEYFAKYILDDGPYTRVSLGFLLELMRQEWGGKEEELSRYCRRVQAIAKREKNEGKNIGTSITLQSSRPSLEISLTNLWHYNPSVDIVTAKTTAKMDRKKYGVHPDTHIEYLLGLEPSEEETQYLNSIRSELRPYEEIYDAPLISIPFKEIVNGTYPRLEEIIKLLVSVNRSSTFPMFGDFFDYLVSKGMPNTEGEAEVEAPDKEGQSANQKDTAEKVKIELRFSTGKIQSEKSFSEKWRYELTADGKQLYVTVIQYSCLLALAIQKLIGVDPPGILNKNPKICDKEAVDIIPAWANPTRAVQHARDALKEMNMSRTDLVKNYKPVSADNFTALKWTRDEINIEDLEAKYRDDPNALPEPVLKLLQTMKEYKAKP